jgi:hypothetical protein
MLRPQTQFRQTQKSIRFSLDSQDPFIDQTKLEWKATEKVHIQNMHILETKQRKILFMHSSADNSSKNSVYHMYDLIAHEELQLPSSTRGTDS